MNQDTKKSSAPINSANTPPISIILRLLLPPWRLGRNVRIAEEPAINGLSDGAIGAEWTFAAIVIAGVVLELWFPMPGDVMVAGGIAGEVLASMVAHLCSGELTRRSNNKLAELTEANSELQKRLAPRNLSPQQIEDIASELRALHGVTFGIVTYPADPEPNALAVSVVDALTKGGWKWGAARHFDQFLGVVSGVRVTANMEAFNKDGVTGWVVSGDDMMAAATLVSALKRCGIGAEVTPDESRRDKRSAAILVGIGKKP